MFSFYSTNKVTKYNIWISRIFDYYSNSFYHFNLASEGKISEFEKIGFVLKEHEMSKILTCSR